MYKHNKEEVIEKLKAHIEKDHASQKAYAKSVGDSETTVSFVLHGRLEPTDNMLASIGMKKEKITLYSMAE